jgi:hypothetical protein
VARAKQVPEQHFIVAAGEEQRVAADFTGACELALHPVDRPFDRILTGARQQVEGASRRRRQEQTAQSIAVEPAVHGASGREQHDLVSELPDETAAQFRLVDAAFEPAFDVAERLATGLDRQIGVAREHEHHAGAPADPVDVPPLNGPVADAQPADPRFDLDVALDARPLDEHIENEGLKHRGRIPRRAAFRTGRRTRHPGDGLPARARNAVPSPRRAPASRRHERSGYRRACHR